MTVGEMGLLLHKAHCRDCVGRPPTEWACIGGCESTIGYEYLMDPFFEPRNKWEGVDL